MVYMTVPGAVQESILERICRENLDVYRVSQPRPQETFVRNRRLPTITVVALVFELLQNADDALAETDGTGDRVLFRLTDHELWVANTGRPFTEADVRGLCGLGTSSKTQSDGPKRASIGHKGLGFKSVLEITEAPEAYSDSVCFQLGRLGNRISLMVRWLDARRVGLIGWHWLVGEYNLADRGSVCELQ